MGKKVIQLLICLIAAVAGAFLALVLSWGVDLAHSIFQSHQWLLWFLTVAGIGAYAMHRLAELPLLWGTIDAVNAAIDDGPIPLELLPVIFFGTLLTIVFGGSVGKEAAALQMGAVAACYMAEKLKGRSQRRTTILCGMCAAFSALLGAPVCALFFVLEMINFKKTTAFELLCLIASAAVGKGLCLAAGGQTLSLELTPPSFSGMFFGATACMVLVAALCAWVFVHLLTRVKRFVLKREFAGPVCMLVLSLAIPAANSMLGFYDCSGTGMGQISQALDGRADTWFFLFKLAATAAFLCCGFKGGEIMPTMCIGATLGCVAGSLAGADSGFMAALGLVAMLAACTNCPIAAVALGCEAFGLAGIGWYLMASALAFALTMPISFYGNVALWRRLRKRQADQ